ncbi:MAG: TolC family protein, partial [Gammaproteobacteria bacterium]|nr:TolC family protein [Gammaproteobacteria bacterium]
MMFLIRGGGPHSNKSTRPPGYIVATYFIVLLSLQQATAQVLPPLTLAEAEDLALRQEPGLSEFQARADALEEQAVAAGQLPDPVLRVGLANFPIESGGFTTEGMTQGQLGIRQAFPPGKTRSLSTQQFQSLSTEMDRNADARARDVLTLVRTVWLDAYYWERAHAIVSDSRPYFDDLVTVTRSLYGVGKKNQQDVLRAELELSRLDDRLIDVERQRRAARAALSQWV